MGEGEDKEVKNYMILKSTYLRLYKDPQSPIED